MPRLPLARFHEDSPHDDSGVVLLLQVPRENEKKELAAEQMFASLYGLLTVPTQKMFAPVKRERLSFEIAVLKRRIGFYVWVPNYLKGFVEEQIYAQYPSVQISEIPDYTVNPAVEYMTTLTTEMKFTGPDVLPIKTFQSFEVDPLASITATLAKFTDEEEAWIQLVVRPAPQRWHRRSEQYIDNIKRGGGPKMTGLLSILWAPPEIKEATIKPVEYDQTRATSAEEKSQKLAFEVAVRVVYRGNVPMPQARLQMQSIVASYKQFNTTYLNGFMQQRIADDARTMALYRTRDFNRTGLLLNIEEMATLYHLPHTNVETPFILWASAQTAEPPASLPVVTAVYRDDLSPVANTNFRGHNTMFGMPRGDRGRHMYIIGQTGTGKSGMLELLTISDIYSPYGFAVVDPHGDYAQHILARIPSERADDVIYFNPADVDFPMAFNPMEVTDPKLKTHTASELIGVLKRMFESWGPRLEYILRYSLLALLDYPDATMLDITRLLTDKKFRAEVLKYVDDPVVRSFWTIEFTSWNDRFAAEAVAPVLNKVGAFTANPLVRNIIGQPKSSFNIRQIMDQRKILIVNLSRGLIGEDNASLLGALIVTKIQLGAMSRADVSAAERSPFYLYVDEFQNFATDSFATILSEARKYGLCLTVANQYIAQMPLPVKDAVFGNVGTIVAFRMGADDARVMLKYVEPKFTETDLMHMHNRHFVISMTIDGEKVPAFSAITLNLPEQPFDQTSYIVEHSRATYASTRTYVERVVGDRYLTDGMSPRPAQPSPLPQAAPRPVASKPATVPAPISTPAPVPVQANDQQTPGEPKKKKRKRNRNRSPEQAASASTPNQPSAPAAAPASVPRQPDGGLQAFEAENSIKLK